jgi:hypothetical protein
MSVTPWSFFKHIYVIRSSPCSSPIDERIAAQHPILIAPATTNTSLTTYYYKKHVFDPAVFNAEAFSELATHRFLWERAMLEADSPTPFWILVLENRARLHPQLTDALFGEYLAHVPSDALFLKFGYLAAGAAAAAHTPANRYWTNFNVTPAYSNLCYAVRSDLCPALLKHKFTHPLDWMRIPHAYGATDLELIVGSAGAEVEAEAEFRKFFNPVLNAYEEFRGIVSKI